MRRWISALAALALWATPALADLAFYVKTNGNNTLDGTTLAKAWQTIAYANANLPPPNTANGHVTLYIGDNVSGYPTFPNPVSSPANGKRYFIVAFGFNGTTPNTNCVLPGGVLSKSSTSLIGFRMNSGFEFAGAATLDTVSYCSIAGDVNLNGADSVAMYRNAIVGSHFTTGLSNCGVSYGVDLIENTMTLTASGGNKIFQTGLPVTTVADSNLASRVERLRMLRNRITTICNNASGDFYHRYHYLTANSLFQDNYWWAKNAGSFSGDAGARPFRIRDSTFKNLFRRDTVIALNALNTGGAQFTDFYMSSHTVSPVDKSQSNYDNQWDSCVVITDAAINWQDGLVRDTLLGNVFVVPQMLVSAGPVVGSLWDGNTILTRNDANYGGLNFEPATFGTDTTKFYNNIFASALPGTQQASTSTSMMSFHDAAGYANWGKSNWNLYSFYPFKDSQGDRCLLWQVDGVGKLTSPVGPTAANTFKARFPANRRGDADSLSTWGSAQFDQGGPDSTWGANFDPKIGSASKARAIGKSGIDAGARQYVAPPLFVVGQPASMLVFRGEPGSLTGIFIPFTVVGGDVTLTMTSSDPSKVVPSDPGAPTFSAGLYLSSISANHTFVAGEASASGTITISTNDPTNPTVVIPWQIQPTEPSQ